MERERKRNEDRKAQPMARIVFSLLFPRLHRLRGVAACVRRAVHGWQRGWERGRWLARLILSAAEMVRPLSAPSILFVSSCLTSPFSHPPVFSLCSHFHLNPPRPVTVYSRPRLVFHSVRLPRFISPPVTPPPSTAVNPHE